MFNKLFIRQKKHQMANRFDSASTPEADDYDGYYDDVLPPDLEELGEPVDKKLIKKVIVVVLLLLLIVSFCVLLLYL